MRTCSLCSKTFGLDMFHVGKYRCKPCARQVYLKNAEEHREKQRQYYASNKEKKKEYHLSNRDRILAKKRKHWTDHKDVLNQRQRERNKRDRQKRNKYEKDRRSTDPLFAAKKRLRNLIRKSITASGYKKSSKTAQLLGADFQTVFNHLQSTALTRYGTYLGIENYHIDHVVPLASAGSTEELKLLQHYTNLQLLLPVDNLLKGANV